MTLKSTRSADVIQNSLRSTVLSDFPSLTLSTLILAQLLTSLTLEQLLKLLAKGPDVVILSSVVEYSLSDLQAECVRKSLLQTASLPSPSFLSSHETLAVSLVRQVTDLLRRFNDKVKVFAQSLEYAISDMSASGSSSKRSTDVLCGCQTEVYNNLQIIFEDLKTMTLVLTRLVVFLWPLDDVLLKGIDDAERISISDLRFNRLQKRFKQILDNPLNEFQMNVPNGIKLNFPNSKSCNTDLESVPFRQNRFIFVEIFVFVFLICDVIFESCRHLSSEFQSAIQSADGIPNSSKGWRRLRTETEVERLASSVWTDVALFFDLMCSSVRPEWLISSDHKKKNKSIFSSSFPSSEIDNLGIGLFWNAEVKSNPEADTEVLRLRVKELSNIQNSLSALEDLQKTFAAEVNDADPVLSACADNTSRAKEEVKQTKKELLKTRKNIRKWWAFEGGAFGSLSIGLIGAIVAGPVGAVVGIAAGAAAGASAGRALKERENSQLKALESDPPKNILRSISQENSEAQIARSGIVPSVQTQIHHRDTFHRVEPQSDKTAPERGEELEEYLVKSKYNKKANSESSFSQEVRKEDQSLFSLKVKNRRGIASCSLPVGMGFRLRK